MRLDALSREVLEFARPRMAAGAAAEWSVTPLAGDGSGRRYFRVARADAARVVIVNPLAPGRSRPDENEGFLAIRDFLDARGVRVPGVDDADLERGFLLIEDLGDERLCDRVEREGWDAWPSGSLPGAYHDLLQSLAFAHAPGVPVFRPDVAPNPPYTEAFILEWEAGYFHAELVRGWARLDRGFGAIAADCRTLAREALGGREALERHRVFMHRDFQSRNLMVLGSTVAVIDFQGGRIGPPEYDLAAVLYDPYVSMPESIRRELTAFYAARAAAAGVPGVPAPGAGGEERTWRRRFLASAANRLMQALGAYGKLGGRLGRPGFLEHIPAALGGMEAILAEREDCPSLLALVRELRGGRA